MEFEKVVVVVVVVGCLQTRPKGKRRYVSGRDDHQIIPAR